MSDKVLVGIVMGSTSDYKIMQEAEKVLKELDVSFETKILSAHRTPEALKIWMKGIQDRGCRVFIAGAGMAAHLAGAVAAHTLRPVIGVPLNASELGGLDALLSTVQMPSGIPVATTSIGAPGAKNAAILAAQMIALSDPSLEKKLKDQREEKAKKVLDSKV